MYTRLGLFTLILCIATSSQAYRIQQASVIQGPYQAPPSGAMSNARTGLDTQPQEGVTGIQPLIPNQSAGNAAEQTNDQRQIQANPTPLPQAQRRP